MLIGCADCNTQMQPAAEKQMENCGKMKKIAIIDQRYGMEVNGGSEYYARMVAEHLQAYYDVTVLTTTALDYDTWENHYPAGNSWIHGIRVRRFPVTRRRHKQLFLAVSKCTFLLKKAGIHIDQLFLKAQGPVVPQLVQYIREHAADYDVFLFVTYLYYPTVMGLPEVAAKSILIPTAHDEPYIYLQAYRKIFTQAGGMIYLTEEEKKFVEHLFGNSGLPHDVAGIGIDVPHKMLQAKYSKAAVQKFRAGCNVQDEYFVYAGRVDTGKNCEEMFAFFQQYKQETPGSRLQLIIIGKSVMQIPKHPDIHYLGYVSEEEKYAAVAGAKWLWHPSKHESLSIALLEGMMLGTPGIVNGECEVLKGHCLRSGGAVFYKGYGDFKNKVDEILGYHDAAYAEMGRRARKYVEENYRWETVEGRLCKMIDFVQSRV